MAAAPNPVMGAWSRRSPRGNLPTARSLLLEDQAP
jgi:hypothetical protein